MNTVIIAGLPGPRPRRHGARRGIHARHLYAAGFAINRGALALDRAGARRPLWWSLFTGLGAASNVLGFTALGEGIPRELTGRLNTTLNP